jgi:hypothetical protein
VKYLSGFFQSIVPVADRRVSECVDPEGNGVSSGKGARGGGPGPPSEKQDKKLVCNSGGDETPMGEPGGQQDGSDET